MLKTDRIVRLAPKECAQLRQAIADLNNGSLRKVSVNAELCAGESGYYIDCTTKKKEGYFPETKGAVAGMIGSALRKQRRIHGAHTSTSPDGKTLRIYFKVR